MVLSISLALLHLGSKLLFSRCLDPRVFSGAPPKDNLCLHVLFIFIWLYMILGLVHLETVAIRGCSAR